MCMCDVFMCGWCVYACVCVCVCERESVCLFVLCVCERGGAVVEWEREDNHLCMDGCVFVFMRVDERTSVT